MKGTNRMIRRARPEDAGRIAEIQVFGWRSAYRGIIPDQHLFGNFTVDKRTAIFTGTISAEQQGENNGGSTWVNEREGLVLAFMTCGPCRDSDLSDSFELWGIYVEPGFKRQGLGAELEQHCLELARELGYSEIALWVFRDNVESRRFYERMGYVEDMGRDELMEGLGVYKTRYRKALL